jgi:hypothetical protein
MLPALLPVPQGPDGAILLGHLHQQHATELGPYPEGMRTEDVATVVVQASELLEDDGKRSGESHDLRWYSASRDSCP